MPIARPSSKCIDASQLFAAMLHQALLGADKDTILSGHGQNDIACASVRAIAQRAYQTKSIDQIRGSGYVVESLEAALWCFDTTDSFEAAILQAANLGDDADTTAAICGQIAGAFYGESGIPPHWLGHLTKAGTIRKFADRLWQIGSDGTDADDIDILQGALAPDGIPCAMISQGAGSRRRR